MLCARRAPDKAQLDRADVLVATDENGSAGDRLAQEADGDDAAVVRAVECRANQRVTHHQRELVDDDALELAIVLAVVHDRVQRVNGRHVVRVRRLGTPRRVQVQHARVARLAPKKTKERLGERGTRHDHEHATAGVHVCARDFEHRNGLAGATVGRDDGHARHAVVVSTHKSSERHVWLERIRHIHAHATLPQRDRRRRVRVEVTAEIAHGLVDGVVGRQLVRVVRIHGRHACRQSAQYAPLERAHASNIHRISSLFCRRPKQKKTEKHGVFVGRVHVDGRPGRACQW